MTGARPDPDELLRRVQADERKQKRGRLTIFFGAAPGVGKTFAMLQEASFLLEVDRRDVVVGIVETHGVQELGHGENTGNRRGLRLSYNRCFAESLTSSSPARL